MPFRFGGRAIWQKGSRRARTRPTLAQGRPCANPYKDPSCDASTRGRRGSPAAPLPSAVLQVVSALLTAQRPHAPAAAYQRPLRTRAPPVAPRAPLQGLPRASHASRAPAQPPLPVPHTRPPAMAPPSPSGGGAAAALRWIGGAVLGTAAVAAALRLWSRGPTPAWGSPERAALTALALNGEYEGAKEVCACPAPRWCGQGQACITRVPGEVVEWPYTVGGAPPPPPTRTSQCWSWQTPRMDSECACGCPRSTARATARLWDGRPPE